MERMIKKLDKDLKIIETNYADEVMEIHIRYDDKRISVCPKCGEPSGRVHSHYTRYAWDLPVQEYKVKLIMHVREYFCDNEECPQKIFSDQYDFLGSTRRRTKRLEEYILNMTKTTSAIGAEKILRKNVTQISNDSILRMIKKNSGNQL